jgi:hypothetical protein
LLVYQPWDCCYNIKDEFSLKIVQRDLLDIIVSIGPFEEVHDNLDAVDEINGIFHLDQL